MVACRALARLRFRFFGARVAHEQCSFLVAVVGVLVQLFYSFFKTLVGKELIVELKNDLAIRGTLHSVDQYLNIKLTNVSVLDEQKYPHMVR